MRPRLRNTLGSLIVLGLASGPVAGDEVFLKGGGRVSGRVVERTATRLSIETGPGRVTLSMSRVERIVESRSAVETFAERADALDPGDVHAWAELARWAEERDLLTQARLAWQRVLAQDPRNPEANAGVGRIALDGVWMSPDDAYRAQGYVSFEGRWLTPPEHEAAVREREAEEASARQAREDSVRLREAEARAREAEARAREAETMADEAAYGGGIPLGYVWGASPVLLPTHDGRHDGRPRRPRDRSDSDFQPGPRPTPRPAQNPAPPPPNAKPRRQHAGVAAPPARPPAKR
jgi:hypothetical protein